MPMRSVLPLTLVPLGLGLLCAAGLRGLGMTAWAADLAALALAGMLAVVLVRAWSRARDRRVRDLAGRIAAVAAGTAAPAFRAGIDADLLPLARSLEDTFRTMALQQAELQRDRARLEAVLAGMVEGVLVVNAAGEVELINEAARALLRLHPAAAGRRYVELIRHPEIAAQVTRALAGEMPPGVELSLSEPGQVIVARAAPAVATGLHGAVLVLHDISDLRRADRIRRDFVANVSHELRTPLTAIRGYAEALLDGPADAEETHQFLEVISRHARRMETLVKDLLRLARLDAGQEVLDRVPCNVEQIFAGVVSDLAPTLEARGQQVEVAIAPGAGTVEGDPAKLHDVLRNLLENASNYSPERSRITLEAAAGSEHLDLRVADEGPGIPDSDLQRIFERFYRVDKARSRETGGTGLGLSIVKHLVELHGGEVFAANRRPTGAVFTVRLPRASRGVAAGPTVTVARDG